ncbi:MAG: YecA family protein [Gammaproteobacteria bacterium]|nr:YecA family protein [Gammaproteobacteria bacterium]
MTDSDNTQNKLNFNELTEYFRPFLQQIGMNSSLAEAHGLFTGILCVNPPSLKETQTFLWFDLLDLHMDSNNYLASEARNEIDVFYQSILAQLNSEDLDFKLLISEEDNINDQVTDFSVWIQSFLYGLGLNKEALLDKGSQEIKDFIKDIVEISHAEDYQLSDSDEDENALFELVEYVRMGVLLIYQEFSLSHQIKIEKQGLDQNLEQEPVDSKPLGQTLFH